MRQLKIRFSKEMVEELDVFLTQTKDVRVFRRGQAVREVIAGQTMQSVSTSLHLTYSALRKWVYRFSQYGVDGLHDQPRPGRPRKITPEIQGLIWEISQNPSREQLYTGTTKSCTEIVNLIEKQTGIALSRESIRRVLRSGKKKSKVLPSSHMRLVS